jgi:hypothetical protein
MAGPKKQQFSFKGEIKDDSILIGNYGDANLVIDGIFDLSGIIYCPKFTVTVSIEGNGVIALRGIAHRIFVKKMSGDCTLDLRDMTCKEFRCESARKKSKIFAGKTRVVTKVSLFDDSILYLSEKPLVTSAVTFGNSQILQSDSDFVLSS